MTTVDQLIREAIAKLRLKLLDLTNRNRLLNFKFTDASKKYVRVVDEIPGHLYSKLTGDDAKDARLYFAALPEPRPDEVDPDDTGVLSPRVSGPLFPLDSIGRHQGSSATGGTVPRLNLAQWARENGIEASYDLLGMGAGPVEEKHGDDQIQTLLLPETLSKKMARIRDDARLAQQEQGTSTLYAAFGFLEWYEDPTSSEARYSPLFLLPVELDRELRHQQYRYFIECGEGADPTTNISLRERLLRDFGFMLPPLEEGDGPEEYLAMVRKAVEGRLKWRVRRFVVIGHFSFARLAMYEDLDPGKWDAAPLELQPLIQNILAGAETGHEDSYAEDFDTESEEVEAVVPALILDADSSQYSAIVDAMRGRSFALKGPPGTGKSQTITNLIAAAISSNKRVLFIAEKLAALEVVSKRLSEAGLGPFTLELHSTKVQKKKVAQAFEERLAVRKPSIVDSAVAGPHLGDLKKTRLLLRSYSTLLNNPVGQSEISLHDAFWHEQRSRSDLDERELVLSSLPLDGDASQKTPSQLYGDLEAVRSLTSGIAAAAELTGSLPGYPLFGLRRLSRDPSSQRQTREALKGLETAVQALRRLRERLGERLRIDIDPSLGPLSEFGDRIGAIHVPVGVRVELLARMRSIETVVQATQLLDVVHEARGYVDHLSTFLDDIYVGLDSATQNAIDSTRLASAAQKLGWVKLNLTEAAGQLDRQAADSNRTGELVELLNTWATQLGFSLPLSGSIQDSLVAGIELLHRTTGEILRHRDAALYRGEARQVLAKASEQFQKLLVEQQQIAVQAKLNFGADPRELITAANLIQSAGVVTRLFSTPYRRAKQLYQEISRTAWDRLEAPTRLRRWAAAVEHRQEFESNVAFRDGIGPAFAGMETPFGILEGVVRFWESVRTGWPQLDEDKGKVQRGLLRQDPSLLEDASSSFSADDLALLRSVRTWPCTSDNPTVEGILAARRADLSDARSALAAITPIRWRQAITAEEAAMVCKEWASLYEITRDLAESRLGELVLPRGRVPERTEIARLRETVSMAGEVLQSKLPDKAVKLILSAKSLEAVRALQQYRAAITQLIEKVRSLLADLEVNAGLQTNDWVTGRTLNTLPLEQLQQRAGDAAAAPIEYYSDWARVWESHGRLTQGGAGNLAEGIVRGETKGPRAVQCFRRAYYRGLIEAVGDRYPEFRDWTGARMHNARQRLVELDVTHIRSSAKGMIQKLSANDVPVGVSRGAKKDLTERSLIENEVGKQSRHIPIRSLLARAFHAALALKPCFMMSPASVSQFLSQAAGVFDLVVIDEASQMRPEDALAALARGKQLVVVGDPMQLPPTTFFDAVQDDTAIDDEGADLAVDTESILDLGLSQLRPGRDLRWHYRSRHESLIAFSNREFYRDRLIVFPSPVAKSPDLGVQYVHVADGAYKASLNPNEAAEVVKMVTALIRDNPNRSIGVVAVNQPQRDLLAEEFDRLFAQDDALETFRMRWAGTLEEFFVNNLENVQGHERDVIVISTVYGPETPGGPVFQRFGPINSKVGHRRLNVLFTRAKELVVLVTSLKSEDIKVLPTSPPGVVALKNYLEFARSGRLDSGIATGRPQDSPFEEEVADVLTQLGHRVQPQVGVAGFFLDLAVRHPARQDHYVLGIECDGATYHSSKSARDRDRLRQEILERLGWKLHRIWSTDWYHGRDREVTRLKQAVMAAVDESS